MSLKSPLSLSRAAPISQKDLDRQNRPGTKMMAILRDQTDVLRHGVQLHNGVYRGLARCSVSSDNVRSNVPLQGCVCGLPEWTFPGPGMKGKKKGGKEKKLLIKKKGIGYFLEVEMLSVTAKRITVAGR